MDDSKKKRCQCVLSEKISDSDDSSFSYKIFYSGRFTLIEENLSVQNFYKKTSLNDNQTYII